MKGLNKSIDKQSDMHMQSMSTRENLTQYKGRITQMDNEDKNSKILNMRQCYVEE